MFVCCIYYTDMKIRNILKFNLLCVLKKTIALARRLCVWATTVHLVITHLACPPSLTPLRTHIPPCPIILRAILLRNFYPTVIAPLLFAPPPPTPPLVSLRDLPSPTRTSFCLSPVSGEGALFTFPMRHWGGVCGGGVRG